MPLLQPSPPVGGTSWGNASTDSGPHDPGPDSRHTAGACRSQSRGGPPRSPDSSLLVPMGAPRGQILNLESEHFATSARRALLSPARAP